MLVFQINPLEKQIRLACMTILHLGPEGSYLQPPSNPPPRSCTVVNSDVNSETVSSASNFCLLPEKPPNPSKDFVFAKLKFGFPYPSWQHNWFDNYPWLHYDIEKDCVFCFYCMKNVSKLTAEKKQRTSMHIGRI